MKDYAIQAKRLKKSAIADLAGIVKTYGKDGSMEIFDLCSDYGLELDGSTIDKLEVTDSGNVLIYYNENENDYDSITHFDLQDICQFVDKLEKLVKETRSQDKHLIEIIEHHALNSWMNIENLHLAWTFFKDDESYTYNIEKIGFNKENETLFFMCGKWHRISDYDYEDETGHNLAEYIYNEVFESQYGNI